MMMIYLDRLEPYADDPRVTKYYASLLPDKRPLNRNRHPVEGGHTIRVCDVALKNLLKRLEKQKLLKWDVTPGFVWDALHAEDFENNIVAIRPYLVKTGVIEDTKQSQLNGPNTLQPAMVTDASEAGKSKAPEVKPAAGKPIEQPASTTTPWSIIVVLVVAALGLLWLLLKRRS